MITSQIRLSLSYGKSYIQNEKKVIIHTNRFYRMATGFCYSKTGIYVLSACVIRDLYLHGLPTGYASWAEAGLYDSGIPYGSPSPIDFSIGLVSGRLVEEGIERVLLDHGDFSIRDLLRRCGFIQLLGIQVGRYLILLSAIARRRDGECSTQNVLYPIVRIRGICARYLRLVHPYPPVYARKAQLSTYGTGTIGKYSRHPPSWGNIVYPDPGGRNYVYGKCRHGLFQPEPVLESFRDQPVFQSDSLIE